MKNRIALAPITNKQSHADGRLSDTEFDWLRRRACGGFGLTMTCAANVQAAGLGFEGQLGVYSDAHIEGLSRLASAIRAEGSLSSIQLHHAGRRAPTSLVGEPIAASADREAGVRALETGEVETLTEAFIQAAVRAEQAGFDGVELHGAHGYILGDFLSAESNRRTDRYGGDLANRSRLIQDIIIGIRARCGPAFQLGLRLSPERYGLKLAEMRTLVQQVFDARAVDYLDLSLWDVFKTPVEPEFAARPLLAWFTDLERGPVRLGVAGKLFGGDDIRSALNAGADFVLLGRMAILHADAPLRLSRDPDFRSAPLPVSPQHLAEQGVSPVFLDYLRTFRDFVA